MRKVSSSAAAAIAIIGLCSAIVVRGDTQSYSFFYLPPEYAQHVFGVTSTFLAPPPQKGYLGGVVVLQNGDVITAECLTNGTQLHRFDASTTYVDPSGMTLHPETRLITAGGCGIALHPNGYLYSNMFQGLSGYGVAQINLSTGASTLMGPPGNALGIAVDPVSLNIVYAGAGCKPGFTSLTTCTLWNLNPGTGAATAFATFNPQQIGYVDGLSFDPTGSYLFLTNRYPLAWSLVVIKPNRAGGPPTFIHQFPTASEPVGLGFHAASPKFVVTNNQDGTLTRFDFSNDDYTAAPTSTTFASGGFRGDLIQAGPDGCLYVTQDGFRDNNGDESTVTNSIVQICNGFAPSSGIVANPPPRPSSLCGFVYLDANDNGLKDPAEAGIAGIMVTLTGADNLGRSVSRTTATAADGSYCLNNLQAGTYTISESQPAAYLDGKDTQGTPGTGTAGNDMFSNIVLAAGVNGQNNNFGELFSSSLCGYAYVDADNNGVKSSTEAGIGGVAVTLTGTDDLGHSLNMPATTGVDGAYCFTNLRPGTYTITETQPAGYLDGKDTQGTPGTGTTANDQFSNIVLNQNVDGRNNNFGEIQPSADLGIAVSAPASALAGGSLNYTLSAVNNGPTAATNIVVTNPMPANTNFVSVAAPSGWTCTNPAPGPGGTLSCTKSTMVTGETAAIQVTVGVRCPFPTPGTVTLAATINASTPDPNPLNNAATAVAATFNPPPVISGVSVDPPELWPPDHKLIDVLVNYQISGSCAGSPTVQLTIASNEPGDGSDWQIVDEHHVRLLSERLGTGNGRIYTITITATVPNAASAQTTVNVTVPHDQR